MDDTDRLRNTRHVVPEQHTRLPPGEIVQPVALGAPSHPARQWLACLSQNDPEACFVLDDVDYLDDDLAGTFVGADALDLTHFVAP